MVEGRAEALEEAGDGDGDASEVCFSPHLPQYLAVRFTLFLHRGQNLSPTPPVAGETESEGLLVEDSLSEEGVEGVEEGVVDKEDDGVDIGVEYGVENGDDEGVEEGVVDKEDEGVDGTDDSEAFAADDLDADLISVRREKT